MANDPKLLEIMEQQGLHYALHTIPAVKEARLGYSHALGDFLERMLVKSGSVNEACGGWLPVLAQSSAECCMVAAQVTCSNG